jgi:hypothetical protein
MLVLATIGSSALYLLFAWLLSAAGAAWVADRKGYTERVGLMFGLILTVLGFVIVLLLPARPGSTWKVEGPFPNPGARRPLGTPALGPAASAPDGALGPALGAPSPAASDEPSAAASDEPPAGGDPPQAGDGPPPAG